MPVCLHTVTSASFPQAQTFEGQERGEIAAPVHSLKALVHGIVYPIKVFFVSPDEGFLLHNEGQGARCTM